VVTLIDEILILFSLVAIGFILNALKKKKLLGTTAFLFAIIASICATGAILNLAVFFIASLFSNQ